MRMRDLIPRNRSGGRGLSIYGNEGSDPLLSLHREMDRLFDDALRGFGSRFSDLTPFSGEGGWPSLEISETDTELRVTAEIPGLEEKDVEILLDNDMLTLRGEKRSEAEDKAKQFSERYYGRFERRIPLGYEVEADKVDARFNNGVLTITLPKSAQAQSRAKRIEIEH
ncbi:Hsp20/alpha crystallin family protein [Devosia nitrariae]|uniref:Heat-shock protein Hsp20 n=1 Tax=Devosia nitrariae TaxID=2071872 RepID=A0ABQ5W584_9HYPH|nr:Hsp20/alpha crystallin family protein [Devosia nitrariae]GLQ55086.1 heat-shock protein Hsp20 [Devosia nitrariae]